jgi:predicted nuclease of predicted toxin-antitoxin system
VNTILVDHDIEGQILILWGALAAEGWLEFCLLQLVTFVQVGLPMDSNDRTVWRFAQAQGVILLTHNRNMKDEDSLEQTLREENTSTSLPVITVGRVERLRERTYRERCAVRLVEIVLEIVQYLGAGRLFIP